jgi:RNA polymerase sigma factor (sigma-70 family)
MSRWNKRGSRVLDEQDLINRMRRGDQRAFDQFFETYATRLGAFAARRSALDPAGIEDIVQMTMINAMRSLGSFRGGSTLFTWLCQICRNLLVDARRKARASPRRRASSSSARKAAGQGGAAHGLSAIRSMSAPRIPNAVPCAARSIACRRITRASSSSGSETSSRFRKSRGCCRFRKAPRVAAGACAPGFPRRMEGLTPRSGT